MHSPTSNPDLHFRSATPHMHWPALPKAGANVLLALQWQFEQSQWWPADRLAEAQFSQLEPLVRHAYDTSPFYRRLYDAAGFDPHRDDVRQRWSQLPIVTRQQVQAAGDAIHSAAPPKDHGKIDTVYTSGSTGRPIKARRTEVDQLMWMAVTLREHLWHRRDFSSRLAGIRAVRSDVPAGGVVNAGWGPAVDLPFHAGPSFALSIFEDVRLQLRWLMQCDPHYLITNPSNLRALILLLRHEGAALPSLRQTRTLGESLPGDLRDLCRQVLGVPVIDMYSAEEVGYMALQCPDHEHYHVQSEVVHLEVLDDAGRPCAPGQVGRVVVTPLHRCATPLIRYEILDYAQAGPPCPCGRGLPVVSRIVGRQRNMIRLPDGSSHFPGFYPQAWADFAPIDQLQLVQTALDRVEARLVTPRPLTEKETADVILNLQKRLRFHHTIDLVRVSKIERSTGGKYEDFICQVT